MKLYYFITSGADIMLKKRNEHETQIHVHLFLLSREQESVLDFLKICFLNHPDVEDGAKYII